MHCGFWWHVAATLASDLPRRHLQQQQHGTQAQGISPADDTAAHAWSEL